MLTNLKVATKLAISSGIAMLLIVGMVTNQQISSRVIADANNAVEREQTILTGVVNAEIALGKARLAARDLEGASSEPDVQSSLKEIKENSTRGSDGLDEAIRIALKPDVLRDIRDGLKAYEGLATKKAAAMLQSFSQAAGRDPIVVERGVATAVVPFSDLAQAAQSAIVAIDQSKKNAEMFTVQAQTALASAVAQADNLSLAIGLCAVLVLLGSSALLIVSVGRPIRTMTEAMLKLAKGDTSVHLALSQRKDEIGAMAGAVETFRTAAIEKKHMEADADDMRHQAERLRLEDQKRTEAEASERLRVATASLAAGLKRLADGDLAFQLSEPFGSEFEQLRHDFNTSVGQLGTTLSQISRTAQTIEASTGEISQAASDLSKRTEQQAASLEETAAALDQITVNVTSASARAEEARKIANEANSSTVKSGVVVASAVDAMSRIEQSSNQISNIIGVIDEIAFQTNLLALNAGVEAARAGEAGKGFAVVAQEVRELAQRSAQAAKEIKGLILTSSNEVSNGVKLVSETGDALKAIRAFVESINQHMEAIATSSKEQSVGLSEVNTAVNQMDQVTQQNAAMVEETTAASSSLATEAANLQQLLTNFQLDRSSFLKKSSVDGLRRLAGQMAAADALSNSKQPSAARGRTVQVDRAGWSEF
ncbi:methyl-accepting chemotaxis protein [Oryzifoliimicrobium ureilyticus]|uniref:methyl-accepting chemotaxis protein n=1 Tax=Oryzifoliimicrobium ureilyticus TaxID=3113724 RepID=UPI0030760124